MKLCLFCLKRVNLFKNGEYMNILLIGNGFDLAHGLPTKYRDFLSFIKIVKAVVIDDNYSPEFDSNFNSKLQEILEGDKENDWNDLLLYREEWRTLVENNVWIDYFLQYVWDEKENWIDFEKEISKVIQIIDNDISVGKYNLDRTVNKISNKFFDDYFIEDYWGKCDEIRTIKIGQIYNECRDWKNAEEIANILSGNKCGPRPTSCADQLSKAIVNAIETNK